jgi:hypothetical protein
MAYIQDDRQAAVVMEEILHKGIDAGSRLLDHVTVNAPKDALVRGRALGFRFPDVARVDPTEPPPALGFKLEDLEVSKPAPPALPASTLLLDLPGQDSVTLHNNALGQLCERAEVPIPKAYLDRLVENGRKPDGSYAREDAWSRSLALDLLTESYRKSSTANARFLVRSVPGATPELPRVAKGFLSDKYRRLDSMPILEAFAGAARDLGLQPYDSVLGDLRYSLRAVYPRVFSPMPGEWLVLGVEWSNSDFGNGKHALRVFLLRLACLNGATFKDSLSEVHLGARLPDDLAFSAETLRLDTATNISALQDVLRTSFTRERMDNVVATLRRAEEKQVDWRTMKTALSKKLLVEELKKVEDSFKNTDDVTILPGGQSAYRLSNAISWLAGKTPDGDRKLELSRLAGQVLEGDLRQAA